MTNIKLTVKITGEPEYRFDCFGSLTKPREITVSGRKVIVIELPNTAVNLFIKNKLFQSREIPKTFTLKCGLLEWQSKQGFIDALPTQSGRTLILFMERSN